MLRRTRTHLHGASNRPHTQLSRTHHAFSSEKSTRTAQHQEFLQNSYNPFSSFACKRKHEKKNISATQNDQVEQPQTTHKDTLEQNLRKKYKNVKNIVKLIDHWGFQAKGYLTREQFRLKTEKAIGRQPTQEEINQVMLRHSESTSHIDAKGIVSLLHGSSDGIPIDPLKMTPYNNNQRRQQFVGNLKEDIRKYKASQKAQLTGDAVNILVAKINTGISKMRHSNKGAGISKDREQFFRGISEFITFSTFQKKMVQQIKHGVNFEQIHRLVQSHKNADYLLVDPLLRNTRGLCLEKEPQDKIQPIFISKIESLPNLFNRSLNNFQKRTPFDPVSLLNVDQRKTRFQRSGFTNQNSGWIPNSSSQGVQKDQKQKVLQSLRDQAAIKQIRYENKLNNMRMNRQKQRQNVNVRQELAQEREKNRLQSYRDQQQAYNYINFIKKRWE